MRAIRALVVKPAEIVLGFVGDCVELFLELQGVDRALALAAQAFSALFPILIIVASFGAGGRGDDIASDLIDRLELSGGAADAVRDAFAAPDEVKGSVTIIGLFIAVFAALAFARALQRLYESSWGLQSRGIRSTAWGLGWLALFSLYWAIVSALGTDDRKLVGFIFGFGLWLMTPYVLVERRIAWQRLIPQAALTALGIIGVGVWSSIYMSRAVASSAEQFGSVGVSFALLTWLVALGFTIVIATVLGVVTQQRIERLRGVDGTGSQPS